MEEYGDYSLLLGRHQRMLNNGAYVRVRSHDGVWQEVCIYSKHSHNWYNVLRQGETVPTYSVQLCTAGRWYWITNPGERLPELEKGLLENNTTDPAINQSIPLIEDSNEQTKYDDLSLMKIFHDNQIKTPSILGEDQQIMAEQGLLPTAKDRDNSEEMFLSSQDERTCMQAYHQLPGDNRQNLLLFAEDILEKYSNIKGIQRLSQPIRDMATNLGELVLLRLQNPRPRGLIKNIDAREDQIFACLKTNYGDIDEANPLDRGTILKLESELAQAVSLYKHQKMEAIKRAEPASTSDILRNSEPDEKHPKSDQLVSSTPTEQGKTFIPLIKGDLPISGIKQRNQPNSNITKETSNYMPPLSEEGDIVNKTIIQPSRFDLSTIYSSNEESLIPSNDGNVIGRRKALPYDNEGNEPIYMQMDGEGITKERPIMMTNQNYPIANIQSIVDPFIPNQRAPNPQDESSSDSTPVPAPWEDWVQPILEKFDDGRDYRNELDDIVHSIKRKTNNRELMLEDALQTNIRQLQENNMLKKLYHIHQLGEEISAPEDNHHKQETDVSPPTQPLVHTELRTQPTKLAIMQGDYIELQERMHTLQTKYDKVETRAQQREWELQTLLRKQGEAEERLTNLVKDQKAETIKNTIRIKNSFQNEIDRKMAEIENKEKIWEKEKRNLWAIEAMVKQRETEIEKHGLLAFKRQQFLVNQLENNRQHSSRELNNSNVAINKRSQNLRGDEGELAMSMRKCDPETNRAVLTNNKASNQTGITTNNVQPPPIASDILEKRRLETIIEELFDELANEREIRQEAEKKLTKVKKEEVMARDKMERKAGSRNKSNRQEPYSNRQYGMESESLPSVHNIPGQTYQYYPYETEDVGNGDNEHSNPHNLPNVLRNPNLRTFLEELEFLNCDLRSLLGEAEEVLMEGLDGAVKDLRRKLNIEYGKFKDQSRRVQTLFKLEARRRLNYEKAEEIVCHPTIMNNEELIRDIGDISRKVDKVIKSRGLNLMGTGKDSRIQWPTFTGQTLPLIGDFLAELESLLIQAGIPVSGRGAILGQSVKGQAKHILASSTLELNPSFEQQARILLDHFGQVGSQTDLLQRLHKGYGPIPATHDLGQSVTSIYNVTKNHITVLQAAESLSKQYRDGKINEDPITGSYLNSLELILPREDRRKLYDTQNYGTMETHLRFTKVIEAYERLQRFTSIEVAKHGFETDTSDNKKKKHPLFMVTDSAKNPPYKQNNTIPPGPPQFIGSPPSIQLPLPHTNKPSTSVQCFKCFQMGHYANECPTKLNQNTCNKCSTIHPPGQCLNTRQNLPSNAPWRRNIVDQNGNATIHFGGQQVQLRRIEDGWDYLQGEVCCYLCRIFAQKRGYDIPPSTHIFTPSGKLDRSLCPLLLALPTLEERVQELDKYQICRACLTNQKGSSPDHSNGVCSQLIHETFKHLKCNNSQCKVGYMVCVEHKEENQEKIDRYVHHTAKKIKHNISMATTKAFNNNNAHNPTISKVFQMINNHSINNDKPKVHSTSLIATHVKNDQSRKVPDFSQLLIKQNSGSNISLNVELSGNHSNLFTGVKDLLENTPHPFIPANENPHHFILFQMEGRSPDKPLTVCFDTASAYTLMTEEAINDKIGGSPVQIPGTSTISGIGGDREASNFFCSLPLNENMSGGFAAKIASCLTISDIIKIDSVDIGQLVDQLKMEYGEQLPTDFDLHNFNDLGPRLELDILIGIQEIQIFPQLILTTKEGLNIYRVPLKAANNGPKYCIGGSLPTILGLTNATSFISSATPTSKNLHDEIEAVEKALTTNLSSPNFLGGEYDLKEISAEVISENREIMHITNPSFVTIPSDDNNHIKKPYTPAEEKSPTRPNFIIASQLTEDCLEVLQNIQNQIIQLEPSNALFRVPKESLHITHLVGIRNNQVEDMFLGTADIFKAKTFHPQFVLGNVTMLADNLCIQLKSDSLSTCMDALKQECDRHLIWYDPMQSYHITLFKKDYKNDCKPTSSQAIELSGQITNSIYQLNHVDLCPLKRSNKNSYFDIQCRIQLHNYQHVKMSPKKQPSLTTTIPSDQGLADSLSPTIKGLCNNHRELVNSILSEIHDWRNLESTNTLIEDIYPSIGSQPSRNTIPIKLFDLLRSRRISNPIEMSESTKSTISFASTKSKNKDCEIARGIFDEDMASFRCLSCRLCPSCSSPGQGGSSTMSLREEVENLLLKNSVSVDLARECIVARHVLPSNYVQLLGDNRASCEKRLRNQLRKLAPRSKEEQDQVKASINKLISRGFVSTKDEFSQIEKDIVNDNPTPYHLPTSLVFKSGSISSPSRVCVDGQAKTSTGYAINDLMAKGGLSLSIGNLIQTWKAYPIVASGDLANFYCRFALSPEFWPLQKFLWVDNLDPEGEIKTYYIKTIIYGLKSSGVVCHYGINKLIEVFDCLKHLTLYVDDAVAGFYTLSHAEAEVTKIVEVLTRFNLPFKGGNMAMTGIAPPKDIINEDGSVGISCVKWEPISDTFTCNTPTIYLGKADRGSLAGVDICKGTEPHEITQWLPEDFNLKQLLSKTASHFDGQLGILSGLIAPLRSLVREVMELSKDDKKQTNWNFIVPAKHRDQFARKVAEIKKVGKFTYKRFLKPSTPIIPNHKGILICFTDSGEFETVVVYMGLMQENKKWHFNLITAKSFLIQNKNSVPKSELNAAAHGANTIQSVLNHFQGKIELTPYLLTDSECCIHWVSNAESLLQIFHRNRVAAIISVFGQNILHVKTDFNHADDISRSNVNAESVGPFSRFYIGPDWLSDGPESESANEILTTMSTISNANLTPDMLNIFQSGVILSQYCDMNIMKLKKEVENSTKGEDTSQLFDNNSHMEMDNEFPPRNEKEESANTIMQAMCTKCQVDIPNQETLRFYEECTPEKKQHAYNNISTSQKNDYDLIDWGEPEEELEAQSIPNIPQSKTYPTLMVRVTKTNIKSIPEITNHLVTTRSQNHSNQKVVTSKQNNQTTNISSQKDQGEQEDNTRHDVGVVNSKQTDVDANVNEDIIDNEEGTTMSPNRCPSCKLCPSCPPWQGEKTAMEGAINKNSVKPTEETPWSNITRKMTESIEYFINPLGKSFSTVCRSGAVALKFIHIIIKRLSHGPKKRRWSSVISRIFKNAPTGVTTMAMIMTNSCSPQTDGEWPDEPEASNDSSLAHHFRQWQFRSTTTSKVRDVDKNKQAPDKERYEHDKTNLRTLPTLMHEEAKNCISMTSLESLRAGIMRYPGMLFARNTILAYNSLLIRDKITADDMNYVAAKLITVINLANTLRNSYCRTEAKLMGRIISNDIVYVKEKNKDSKNTKSFHEILRKKQSNTNDADNDWLQPSGITGSHQSKRRIHLPNDINFVSVMKQSYLHSCVFVNALFYHLLKAEHQFIRTVWPKSKLEKYCVNQDGMLICNSRWRKSVSDQTPILACDPDARDITGLSPAESCPVLDKDSPLYLSMAIFVHTTLDLPINNKSGLYQKHRGISQDLALSLRFAYAPGGFSTFKKIHYSCHPCRLRTRKFLKTREGDVHHSQLAFVKPFFSVHLDLMGPVFIKLHNTTSTRANDNERKIWLLCTICSFSRAVWTEVMQGTSAQDFSDALTRTMSVVGSISHIVTDRLATQLHVAKHGQFVEQIQLQMFQRHGWFFESIPVSRHNSNGLIENRIKGLRKMLSLEGSRTKMKLLEFITHLRLATTLINQVPFGFSFDNPNHDDFKIISPSSFLYPLNGMNRPILSFIRLENGDASYFQVMQTAYEQLLTTFSNAIVPHLMKKQNKFFEDTDPEPINTDHIVLFKKRPNNNFLPGWSLGRVREATVSKDGVTRSVVIEYVNQNKRREGQSGPLEDDKDYETNFEGLRKRVDRNMYKVQTVRQVDELIRLHPISPRQNDIHEALKTILLEHDTRNLSANGTRKFATLTTHYKYQL